MSEYETLHAALQAIRTHIDAELTLSQASVLRAIRDAKGDPSQTDLVNATRIDRSTLADVMRRLLKTKLVARQRSKDDARAYKVTITQAGRSKLEEFERAEKKARPEIKATLKGLGIALS